MIKYVLLLIGLGMLTSCVTNEEIQNKHPRSNSSFVLGYPGIVIISQGWIEADSSFSYLLVLNEIDIHSLIKATFDEVKNIEFTIETQIYLRDSLVVNDLKSYRLSGSELKSYELENFGTWTHKFELPQGQYLVIVRITDHHSGKSSYVEVIGTIPDPNRTIPTITSLLFNAFDKENRIGYQPIARFNIPRRYDTLLFKAQIRNPELNSDLTIKATLYKYKSDTALALPVYAQDAIYKDLAYIGIDYKEFDIIKQKFFPLKNHIDKAIIVTNSFSGLTNGNYRYKIDLFQKDTLIDTKWRDFGIRSLYFPDIRTTKDLAIPLIYLNAEDNEFANAVYSQKSDSLKILIDHFWTKNMKPTKAKKTIEQFYHRVELSNKYFSQHKEGWKTDMGMIYILFGQPDYIEERFNEVYWAYGYFQSSDYYNPQQVFVFRKTLKKDPDHDYYLLIRNMYYYDMYQRARENWIYGLIK